MDRVAEVQRQLDVVQQLTHIGSWEWDLATGRVTWTDELYRIYGLEPGARSIDLEFFLSCVHPDDRVRVRRAAEAAVAQGGRFQWLEHILRPDGSVRTLDTIGEARQSPEGRVVSLLGTCRDVTEEHARAEQIRFHLAEHKVLEMIASGAPLAESLAALVLAVEQHSPPLIGSVLLLDPDGFHVRHGAGPNLPDAYMRTIDGSTIGPRAGSCGTAAFGRRTVVVSDIATDPLWESYREQALAHGLCACWSTPILATDNRVLGTFAFYYRSPRKPSPGDIEIIERAAHVAAIAIERRQLEEQLRDLSAHIESAVESERTGIAREIHDELGQSLTALKMDIAWILRGASSGGRTPVDGLLEEKLGAMSELTDELIRQVRKISSGLRPGVLDDLGLVAAIEWQAQDFEMRTGTTCVVRTHGAEAALGGDASTAVFRVFQEALTNVARHARATKVEVGIEVKDGRLTLEVRDDGAGISPEMAGSPKSLGLLGMRERARRIGGSVAVTAGAPGGTLVTMTVPLSAGSP
jgi:PAS domain S-box-containing protein